MIFGTSSKTFREWILAVLQLFIFGLPEVYPLNQRLKVTVFGTFLGPSASCGEDHRVFTSVYLNHRGFKSQITPIGSQPKNPQKKTSRSKLPNSMHQQNSRHLGSHMQPCPSKDFSYPFHPWKMTIISSSKSLLHINSSSVLHVRRVFEVDDVHGRTDPLSDRKFWDINQAVRHLSVLSCRVNKKEPFTSLNQTFLRLPHTKYNF